MLSGFHITASLHPTSGPLSESQGNPLLVTSSGIEGGLPSDIANELRSRITRLESEVFKGQSINVDREEMKLNVVREPEPILPLADRDPTSDSDKPWSVVFEEIARRLDACASQPSVNECVFQMRQLKRDLVSLSKSLESYPMTESQLSVCKGFALETTEYKIVQEGNSKRSDEPSFTPHTAPPIVKEPVVGEKSWKAQLPRHLMKHQVTSQRSNQKKWGPCFYCPCTDWKPGHTCEGSRLAQIRRKERESRGS
jgi:hypothetical protein